MVTMCGGATRWHCDDDSKHSVSLSDLAAANLKDGTKPEGLELSALPLSELAAATTQAQAETLRLARPGTRAAGSHSAPGSVGLCSLSHGQWRNVCAMLF